MSESKRKSEGGDSNRKKKKYRSDGTPVWGKRHVDGPGVWVSCIKGKEKQAIGEIYELFESVCRHFYPGFFRHLNIMESQQVAFEIWPKDDVGENTSDDDEVAGLSLEQQVANEVSAMKRSRTENPQHRFVNCQTNTPCAIFISCKPPVDPVELVVKYIGMVEDTGITRTRYVHRLVPVSGTCTANLPEIEALCQDVFKAFFDKHPGTLFTYKIELRVRNHTTIPRPLLIQSIAQCVPEGHTVDLQNPRIFILVEVFKSVCGVSIVKDYYRLQKFNVMEIANKKNRTDQGGESGSRVSQIPKSTESEKVENTAS
ncbi:hypothetical protein M413DRAFT_165114 [Hebeloma cylindrosporum]|uniref:THUMP domain-containing protein n=1 Tax=Hebeloma cylindrosporum TaxID=76867 RepID=A0A0C3C8S9_HEBCY|nr:hypothetical protein M413DRAFT_165114 [Hebeloma cylindrosporum h7]